MAEAPAAVPTLALPLMLAKAGFYPADFEGPGTAAMFTLGMLHSFAGGFAAFDTLMPDGTQLPVNGNEQLASLTWQTFGGDAPTAMNLPDLRGKVITGGGPSADAGGAAAVQLNLLIAVTGQASGAPLAGMIVPFIGATIPDGWLACDGSLLSAAEFPALASAIGFRFGGAGGHVALPDLRGAAPVGAGAFATGQFPGAVPGLALDFLLSFAGLYPQPADNLAPAIPATQPFIGQVIAWAGASVPAGWLKADGALLPTPESEEYMELFNLIGTRFGGDGETNFALPDLRGRMIAGAAPAS